MSCERKVVQVSKSLLKKAALKRWKSWETSVSFGSIAVVLCCVSVTLSLSLSLSLCLRLSEIFFWCCLGLLGSEDRISYLLMFLNKKKSKNNLGPGWVVQLQSGNWGKIMVPPACIGLGRNSLEFFYSRNKIPIMFSQIEVSSYRPIYKIKIK